MFTREKNKIDPGRTKSGKTKKPAWETLLSSQAKELEIQERDRAWRRRVSPGLSDDSDGEYDRFNTSISPNKSFKHSRSMTTGQERYWSGSRTNKSDRKGDRLSHSWGPNNFQQSNGFQHEQHSDGFHHSNGFLSSSNNKDVEDIWANARGRGRGVALKGNENGIGLIDGAFQFHPGYPPIPHRLVSKIQRGRYVNFQEIVAENLGGTTKGLKTPIDETDRVNDVTKWVDCMAIYIAIIAHTNPERVQDLLVYQSHIMRLIRVSHDKKSWQRYDVAFRRKAAQNGMTTWGNVDENLWIMACSDEARKPVRCRPCMSVLHDDKTCPITAMNKKDEPNSSKKNMWGVRSHSPNRETQGRSRSASPNRSSQLPKEGLELKFAFGYHGYNACNNLFYTQSNEMAFHVAALGIVYNPVSHQQRFYKGHTDDILCLTIHDFKDYIATGQVGRYAETHVWDATTMRTIARLKGIHKRGIICVDFSGDGKKLADVGLDDDHLICIWDWKKEEKLASTRGHKDNIFVLEWNPFNPNYFVSVGEKHIKFWTHNGSKIDKRPVTFGKAGTAATMLCVCHSPIDDLCFSGSDNGTVYVWQGTTLRRTVQAHKGPVCAMYSMSQSKNEVVFQPIHSQSHVGQHRTIVWAACAGYVTGGRDGVVVMWDKYFENCLKAFKVENSAMKRGSVLLQELPPIRSIHTDEDKILIGTGNDEIIEIGVDGKMTIVVQGHGDGEVWGLDTHPMKNECVTVSDDKTLRIWDLNTLLLKNVKKLKKGGRAVAYSPDGGSLAVGQNDGGFLILEESTLEKVVGYKDRKEEISDIKFSPDGKFLAVGSHDNYVDVYSVKRGKRTGVCKGSSSYITHLDWDVQGRLIQTNSGAREHLFFEAPHVRRQTLTNEDMEKIDWATFTCVLGPLVKGVYPPLSDVTDVNSTARSHDHILLASGDDFGMVKLFNFPVFNRGARYRQYNGHSSHVTNVRWTHDDRLLVSTGGLDTALLVWERVDVQEEDDVDFSEDKAFVQPKFLPTGPVRDPLAKGKPQFD